MSVDVIVLRGAGDKAGDDIEDTLISTVDVALQRGRNECDAASGLQSVSLSVSLKTALKCGDVVEVQDSMGGASWRGMITAVSHSLSIDDDSVEAITGLSIVRSPV